MGIGTNPDWAGAFAAAIDWWGEAGVDATFVDEPRSWLAPPEDSARNASLAKPASDAPVAQAASPAIDFSATLPTELAAFQSWWMTSPDIDGGGISSRVAPRGVPSASLMILTTMPESGDEERLLSGPEGRLIDAFISAAGIPEDTLYRASALPCHSPGADWNPGANRAVIEALARHIVLAAPERLLVVGFNALPLLQHALPQGPAVSAVFNHESATVPMLAVRQIPVAAAQPRWKSVLWRAWLEWAAPTSPLGQPLTGQP